MDASPPYGRMDSGVNTFSLRTRVLLTLPFALVDAFLIVQIILWSFDADPRMAALWLFFLAFAGYGTWLVVPTLWRPSAEWRDEQWAIEQQRRRIAQSQDAPNLRDWGVSG